MSKGLSTRVDALPAQNKEAEYVACLLTAARYAFNRPLTHMHLYHLHLAATLRQEVIQRAHPRHDGLNPRGETPALVSTPLNRSSATGPRRAGVMH